MQANCLIHIGVLSYIDVRQEEQIIWLAHKKRNMLKAQNKQWVCTVTDIKVANDL